MFGIGPGQFARYAARAVPVDAVVLPERPHSFPLALAVAGGLPALACFGAALGLLVWAICRPIGGSGPETEERQITAVRRTREGRDAGPVDAALERLKVGAAGEDNLDQIAAV